MNYSLIDFEIASRYPAFIAPHIFIDPDRESYAYVCAYTDDDVITGMAIFSIEPGSSQLLSVVVSPEYQRQGVGNGLLAYIGSISLGNGIPEISCLYSESEENWEKLDKFLSSCSYEQTYEYAVYATTVGKLKDYIDFEQGVFPLRNNYVQLKDLKTNVLNRFSTYLASRGLFAPIKRNEYHPEYSMFYVENDEVVSCVLCSEMDNGDLEVSYAYLDKDSNNMKSLVCLFIASGLLVYKTKDADTVISIATLNAASEKLAKYMIEGLEKKYVVREYVRDILHTWATSK